MNIMNHFSVNVLYNLELSMIIYVITSWTSCVDSLIKEKSCVYEITQYGFHSSVATFTNP
jgi:hypothetical protein